MQAYINRHALSNYLCTHLDIDSRTHYTGIVKQKAPASVEAPTGAANRTAEGHTSLQLQYPAFGCETQQEISHELPGLQSEV
jgi:hypothetical protein